MSEPAKPKYRRILLKISGEFLKGDQEFGLETELVQRLANEILEVVKLGLATFLGQVVAEVLVPAFDGRVELERCGTEPRTARSNPLFGPLPRHGPPRLDEVPFLEAAGAALDHFRLTVARDLQVKDLSAVGEGEAVSSLHVAPPRPGLGGI